MDCWSLHSFLCLSVLFLVAATLLYQRQTSRSTSEKSVEKIVNYCEEGGGEADQGGFDVVTLRKPIVTASISSDGEMEERAVDIGELTSEKVETTTSGNQQADDSISSIQVCPVTAEIPQHSASDLQELGQFISARLAETQVDPIAPPYDEIRPYEFEGDGVSGGGSLSSLSTTEDNDADLNQAVPTWGPKFAGLAQICEGSDSD